MPYPASGHGERCDHSPVALDATDAAIGSEGRDDQDSQRPTNEGSMGSGITSTNDRDELEPGDKETILKRVKLSVGFSCSAISCALLNSGHIVLPQNDRLQGQIVGLERRTSAVGRDTISHPDRGHDDVANAVAARRRSQIRRIRHQHELGVGRRRQRELAARPSSSLHQQRATHPTMTLSHTESAKYISARSRLRAISGRSTAVVAARKEQLFRTDAEFVVVRDDGLRYNSQEAVRPAMAGECEAVVARAIPAYHLIRSRSRN